MSLAQLKKYSKMRKAERREHPTLPSWAINQIVKDHMKKSRGK